MTDQQYEELLNALFTGAEGDPSIRTGLPAVDLTNDLLRFIRALEICVKVETLRESDEDRTEHYAWYDNLGLENVKEAIIQYWVHRRFGDR
ncbi:MAG: hypothetical protein AB7K68_12745 [Bacteriovoracia bacterium]